MESNSLFSFATSELSQDAFICWCLNWINYPRNDLYHLALDLYSLFEQIDTEANSKIEIIQQFKKIDILVKNDNKKLLYIIEDKTNTSEHGEQLKRYRKELDNEYDEYDIKIIYFKTGFWFDYDKMVHADVYITGNDFLKVLENHIGKNDIVDDYYYCLKQIIENQNWSTKHWNEKNDSNLDPKDKHWGYRLTNDRISQHTLMRIIFNEELMNNIKCGDRIQYQVEPGTNIGGRPWTELNISNNIFWRLDTNSKSHYISLRYYGQYDKKSETEKNSRNEVLKILIQEANCIIDKDKTTLLNRIINCDDNVEKYKIKIGKEYQSAIETTIIEIPIDGLIYNSRWEEYKDIFIDNIQDITNKMVKVIEGIDMNI